MAHDYKPVVIIGGNGLTDAVINETDIVLETHELVKIKVNADDKAGGRSSITGLTNKCIVRANAAELHFIFILPLP